ncbi:Tol-Pal system beta propeller repeat protein TolB [Trichloromonas sp.]|uniref:Tol-Pal system beta propeller repeat protein TolB n=1 Tax=Trichloromonas sp. TaxID=3069249 RepID=UPI003D819AE5
MKTFSCLVITLTLLAALLAPPALAQIEISAPGQQTIPLALTRFLPLDGTSRPELAAEINQVLEADLDLSGLFSLINPESFLGDANVLGLSSVEVDFGQWRLLRAESLIKGGYAVQGDQLTLEARLYDVVSRRLLAGRRYIGKLSDLRRMSHTFADQILKSLTGEAGPFNTRIAYISNRTGNKELYLMEVDGHNPVRITDHRSIVLNPDFSHQGKDLIFTSYKAGNPDLYRKETYSGREAKLSAQQGLNIAGRYRPDGREIALTLSKDGNSELYLISTGGTIHKRLTDAWGIDVDPSWNPNGDQIAFVSDRQGNPHVFILDVVTGQVRRLTKDGKYNVTPAWNPKGDRIAFSRLEGGRFDIYTIRPDGTDERRLTFGPGNKEHARWSHDGRFLVYSSDEDGKRGIYLMRDDGSGSRRVSPAGGDCSHPAWSGEW